MLIRLNTGIALIQVLLISAIISLMALYFSQTARQQVATASKAQDYNTGLTTIQRVEAELLFELLTGDRDIGNPQSSLQKQWNFYNIPFEYGPGVSVAIEDMSGRINISFGPSEELSQLLSRQGLDSGQVQIILQSLEDWVDSDSLVRLNGAEQEYYQQLGRQGPRNGSLQTVSELKLIRGVSTEIFDAINNYLTVKPAPYFNLMTAREGLLRQMLEEDIAEAVIAQRSGGQLDPDRFSQITGLTESEGHYFYPSTLLTLHIFYQMEQVALSKHITVSLAPSSNEPLSILEQRWNQ